MRRANYFFLLIISVACSREADTEGVVYSGNANLNTRLHEFTATNDETNKDIVLTMTGPRELTLSFNEKVSHIDYEDDVIIILSESYNQQWTVKKVKEGFELEDGSLLEFGSCGNWEMCLTNSKTKLPILKGKYAFSGSNVNITLWISESEQHVELLALMANGLFNRSRNAKESIESSLRTLSPQVWTY